MHENEYTVLLRVLCVLTAVISLIIILIGTSVAASSTCIPYHVPSTHGGCIGLDTLDSLYAPLRPIVNSLGNQYI